MFFLVFGCVMGRGALAAPGQASAGEFLTAPFGPNGTWNLYQVAPNPLTWGEAESQAAGTMDPMGGSGKTGHLVSISSGAENMFVYSHIDAEQVWIGLVSKDRLKRGQSSAGAANRGWVWMNGESASFQNWSTDQPVQTDESAVVVLRRFGWWAAQRESRNAEAASMIEWDVNSPTPIKGAAMIAPVLPKAWPAPHQLPPAESGKPWLVVQTHEAGSDGWGRLDALTGSLIRNWKSSPGFWLENINCRMRATVTGNGWGWIFEDRELPGASTQGFGMLCRALLRVPQAGTYTFNVHADDGYAIRVGNHPWKKVYGQGGIDPQDPTALYYSLFSPDGDSRGVIDLPEGEVPIEVFYFNVGLDGAVQIMTAPGDHPLDGSTDAWRLLGHQAKGTVAFPGVDAEGWQVRVSPPQAPLPPRAQLTLEAARTAVAKAPDFPRADSVNFHDPEAAGLPKFPGAAPFPGDPPTAQNNRVVLAEATLVVPRDGVWHIGARADDACLLQIDGQSWIRTVKDVSGSTAVIAGDTLSVGGNAIMPGDTELIGEINLKKGSYKMRVVSVDFIGPSVFQVFAAPAGGPPRLLTREGATIVDDLPGLAVRAIE